VSKTCSVFLQLLITILLKVASHWFFVYYMHSWVNGVLYFFITAIFKPESDCQPLVPGILNPIFLYDKGYDINSFILMACFTVLKSLCITGQVQIEFRVDKETNFIVFHSKNLTITEKVSTDSCMFMTGSYSKVVGLMLSCMCDSVHK